MSRVQAAYAYAFTRLLNVLDRSEISTEPRIGDSQDAVLQCRHHGGYPRPDAIRTPHHVVGAQLLFYHVVYGYHCRNGPF